MKVAITEFPGSFGLLEIERVCFSLGAEVERLWFLEEKVPEVDLMIIPSGSSFGDFLRPGALASRTRVGAVIKSFARAGGNVLGIGNGFQILCEMDLLPGICLKNSGAKFRNTEVHIRFEGVESFFTKGVDKDEYWKLPVVCGYGAYYADKRTIQDIEEAGLVLFRYVDQFGTLEEEPFLGATNSIAGLKNSKGNVVGVMPRLGRSSEDIPFLKRVFKSARAAKPARTETLTE